MTSSLPLPPGSSGLPILGETLSFFSDQEFATKRRQKHGNIFRSHIFGKPTVFINDEAANNFVFRNEGKYFVSTWPKSTRILLGNKSLATNTGDFHKSRRRLMYQAFQPRALANYSPTIAEITAQYLEKWQEMGELTWYPELRKYTFDVACILFVGQENASEKPIFHWFEEWCNGLFSLPISLPWTRFGKALSCRQKLLNEIENIIRKRQQEQEMGNDALGILLNAEDEDGTKLSLEELKEQILLLLFAGHETLTSSVTSFCLLMGQYPEIFAKVKAEQDNFNNVELTPNNLKEMTYLEQVLQEVLRLIPPVGGVFRETTETVAIKDFQIPKGWMVQCSIRGIHEDEILYPNPEKFNPERFSSEHKIDNYAKDGYFPFGKGMRECLGKEFARLEMKILAAMLAKDYDWQLIPNQDLGLNYIPSPRPRDGLKVNFYKV
jgi:cytochrome P450